jgi:KDO2-lipid IV(A) lauroyltransferase
MVTTESAGRDIARLFIWYPFRWFVSLLPLSWAIALFRLLGTIHFLFARKRVADLESNMSCLVGGYWRREDLRGIVHRYLRNHYVDRLHIFLFGRLRRAGCSRRLIRLQGEEHIRRALERGKGCIIVHGHFGVIQLPLFALHEAGFDLLQVGLPSDHGLSWVGRHVAFRLRLRCESRLPARIIEAGKYMRPVVRHLQQNGVVLITGDGAGGGLRVGRTRRVPFLDGAMDVPEGPLRLARMTGATLLPAFVIDERNGYYKFVIGRPLLHDDDEENRPVHPDPLRRFPVLLERFIERYPWNWHFWDEWTLGWRKWISAPPSPG